MNHLFVFTTLTNHNELPLHRTQNPERGSDGGMVGQGEALPGLLRHEEWRPELVSPHSRSPLSELPPA